MATNGEQLSQQGQSGVDDALWNLLEKIPDEPTRVAVQEMAVRQGKKDKEFEERLDRLTLFCDFLLFSLFCLRFRLVFSLIFSLFQLFLTKIEI